MEVSKAVNILCSNQSWRLSLALFSLENEAEKMFTSMTKKDGGTYGVMIQGLAKVRTD